MPKPTFNHLPMEKQLRVLAVCKLEFEQQPIQQASVASIVKALGIARGSFYQYFDSLEEAFFTVLHSENVDIHRQFIELLLKHEGMFFNALEEYGTVITKELFTPSKQALYRNRFLYWTPDLDQGWSDFLKKQADSSQIGQIEEKAFQKLKLETLKLSSKSEISELMRFTQSIVHQLIQRSFREKWTGELFQSHYKLQVQWMRAGLSK